MPIAESERTLPYGSAATFVTTLDHFGVVGVPNIVDRNALPSSFSGSSKYETLGTLKYFRLIDGDGRPDRERLAPLIDPEKRENALLQLLDAFYEDLILLPLASAGPSEVQKWFNEHATPSTARKAKTFFLALAKQTKIKLHPMVSAESRVATGSVRRKRKRRASENGSIDESRRRDDTPIEPTRGATRTVALRESKGSVSVSVPADLWELKGEDRDFVLFLVNLIQAWEGGVSAGIWARDISIE